MRDIFITTIVFGSLPFILKRPWIGIIVWCWLSYMNPHKQAWGFATNMPFAMMTALATLLGMLFSSESKKVPWTREAILLFVLICWMGVTTSFAYFPDLAIPQFEKVLKIQLMTFVTLMLITTRERVHAVVWIIALSLGYYGIKGGIFTVLHGGAFRVQGPTGTFIAGNNELALALVMTIPLMRYLQLNTGRSWLRLGLVGAMVLTALAAVGSHSRGALIALGIMGIAFWLKSRKRLMVAAMAALAVGGALAIMPAQYFERMQTIETYEQDASAMGRLNAWHFAVNLTNNRPIVGGGFETFQPSLFRLYAPNPNDYHDVHSIYFEMLGEHGYVGLGLFLLLGFCTWRTASRVKKRALRSREEAWMVDLVSMVQVSLIAYAAGGAFLGLAYFDLPYHLVSLIIICSAMQASRLAQATAGEKDARKYGPQVRPLADTGGA